MADVVRILVSLAAVVAGCLGTAWLARRSRGSARHGLRVVGRVPVSKSSSLLVVAVGSRMLLVGAAEGGLRLISELDPADVEPDQAPAAAAAPALFDPVLRQPARSPNADNRGPWTGLIRNLQRMTLRTTPVGPSRVRKR